MSLTGRILQKLQAPEHFDTGLRYRVVARILAREYSGEPLVLDVGSGPVGLAPYLPHRVYGVDTRFRRATHPHLVPVQGSAASLPFADGSFDAVVSCDALEHVPPPGRPAFLRELCRVSRDLVIVVVPEGEAAEQQDRRLDAIYEKVHGCRYSFLVEHVDNGLPRQAEVAAMLRDLAPEAELRVLRSTPLWLRELFMRSFISPGKWARLPHLLGGWLNPLWERLPAPATYRAVFVLRGLS